MTARPLIAVPARFSATSSALDRPAEANARALIEAVWRAGGEPGGIHPHAPGGTADPDEVRGRLARFDGLLLPGGGDLAPYRYGAKGTHRAVYDVDDEQDGFDLELARQALARRLPLLAVCRGLQVVNTALGGTLHQDNQGGRDGQDGQGGGDAGGSGHGHRHVRHPVFLAPWSVVARVTGTDKAEASCYHHQHVDRLGEGLKATAHAVDGTVEAVELVNGDDRFMAVQWHPEDTARTDPAQQRLFDALVRAARRRAERE
ncbi:gamma-glutamyl-gamma-aminobutyrate hydrolase family protein [Streptomyces sp. NPDC059517]|uniref:gamma-glutamyl-gamma-aminobutyrate hydrolase family protein n=1 Tax=Streptomyces sp. NPDC059517 TaxID=3346855 RepID=UPI0036CA2D5B